MIDPDRHLWTGMLSYLRANHPTVSRQWFDDLVPLGIGGGALNLRAKSNLHRDYLIRCCSEAFCDAAQSVSGHLIAVRFLGPDDPPVRDSISKSKTPKQAQPAAPPASPSLAAPISQDHVVSADGASPNSASADVMNADHGAAASTGGASQHVVEPKPLRAQPLHPEAKPNPSQPSRSLSTFHDARAYESLVINPDNAFESFVVGPGNRLAHAAALSVAATPGRGYNPYFIHGGVGLGKTHILQAICLRIAQTNPRVNLYYVSCEGFVTKFMECVQSGEMAYFRHRFRDVDVLVIDDIHFLAKRDRTQEEFFHTFNTLHHAGKQIILSSDAPPEEIPDLEDRLVSRFKWGLVVKIDPPCRETRVEILKTKARLRGITLPDDVAMYIAERIDSNIRELEGAIGKIQILASVENRPIDLDLTRQAIGDIPPAPNTSDITLQVILGAVTEFYNIRVTDLQSKKRQRSVALPRQVSMYLARKHTRMSLEEIGGYFGGRDHTTVMHAVKTIEARRPETEFDLVIRTIEEKFRPLKHAP